MTLHEYMSGLVAESLFKSTLQDSRPHLGFSEIGKDARLNWLKFRWSFSNRITGKQERIFSLGHFIEEKVIHQIRRSFETLTTDKDGNQIRYSYLSGHLGGSQDLSIKIDDEWYVCEIKGLNKSTYGQIVKHGLKKAHEGYWTQIQCYISAGKYSKGIFIVVDKSSCDIHIEVIDKDPMVLSSIIDRADCIFSTGIPKSSWSSRSHFEAKFLSQIDQEIYWGDRIPRPNCRNCKHSIIDDGKEATLGEGAWLCGLYNKKIPNEFQKKGCDKHIFFSDFIPFPKESKAPGFYNMEGVLIYNSSPRDKMDDSVGDLSLSSKGLHELSNKDMFLPIHRRKLKDALVGLVNLKEMFNAELITEDDNKI